MANRIGIRPRARLDVVEQATYIGKDSVLAANRFLDASEATFEFLAESPQIGSVYPTKNQRLQGLRVCRVKGFPNHLAFYLARNYRIEIVRVVHGARDLDAALKDELLGATGGFYVTAVNEAVDFDLPRIVPMTASVAKERR